jgi:hypothetical protein
MAIDVTTHFDCRRAEAACWFAASAKRSLELDDALR